MDIDVEDKRTSTMRLAEVLPRFEPVNKSRSPPENVVLDADETTGTWWAPFLNDYFEKIILINI